MNYLREERGQGYPGLTGTRGDLGISPTASEEVKLLTEIYNKVARKINDHDNSGPSPKHLRLLREAISSLYEFEDFITEFGVEVDMSKQKRIVTGSEVTGYETTYDCTSVVKSMNPKIIGKVKSFVSYGRPLYYVSQEIKTYTGYIDFWAESDKGYTKDLNKARLFTQKEIDSIEVKEKYSFWPQRYIDECKGTIRVVEPSYLNIQAAKNY